MLDLMRGIAAVLVCAGHLRNATMVDLGSAKSPGLADTVLYALTSLGHQSVMVFFVLSGYLVGGSVLTAGPRFSWRNYAQARLSRLWTVLLPCLALTWAIDQTIVNLAPQVLSGAYAALWHSAPQPNHYDASLSTLLGNLVFLQTIKVPVFGSNGPLWSLANEFWYYVLFPLMLMAFAGRKTGTTVLQRGAAAVLMMGLGLLLPAELLCGYAIWLMGVVAFVIPRMHTPTFGQSTNPDRWLQPAMATLAFLAALGFSKWATPKSWPLPWGDFVLGTGVAYFVYHCAPLASARPWPRWMRSAVERLSDMSFSLYLSHFPLVMLIGTTAYLDERLQPSLAAWTVMLGWLAALLLAGHVVWWLCERHTSTVRRMMAWPMSAQRGIRHPPSS
ncbi:MAG: acyltransferase [Massilia sp.]|nr:acyltransferase [Aquabacterium sp.]